MCLGSNSCGQSWDARLSLLESLCVLNEVSEHLWAVLHMESVCPPLLQAQGYVRLMI